MRVASASSRCVPTRSVAIKGAAPPIDQNWQTPPADDSNDPRVKSEGKWQDEPELRIYDGVDHYQRGCGGSLVPQIAASPLELGRKKKAEKRETDKEGLGTEPAQLCILPPIQILCKNLSVNYDANVTIITARQRRSMLVLIWKINTNDDSFIFKFMR